MSGLDPQKLSRGERHRLVINSVVPRPIAWITTVDEAGVLNLAPFSYFMGVTASPPCVAVSIGTRNPPKDTLANLRATAEAVVHIVPPPELDTVNQTGAEYVHTVSEVKELGLETLPSEKVRPERLALADVALECRLDKEIQIGSPGSALCVLEIVYAHVREEIALADGLPDPEKHRGVARLGETYYLRGDGWHIAKLDKPEAPEGLGVRRDC